MRISQLSRVTGVSQATIKYYLREGLLPPGEAVTATLAEYGDEHVQRLRLIRALIDVGSLSVSATAEILRALDDPRAGMHDLLGATHHALTRPTRREEQPSEEDQVSLADVDALIRERGWHVDPAAPPRARLAHALSALRRLGLRTDVAALAPYADAAESIAAFEVGAIPTGSRVEAALYVVLGTVLYEPVLSALRLLAQEAASARRVGPTERKE